MAVFVKINEYETLAKLLEEARDKLDEIKNTLAEIEDLREKESQQVESWKNEITEVDELIHGVDDLLLSEER